MNEQNLPYKHCEKNCQFVQDGKCVYREMHTPTIAIDFDRVLFTHDKWDGHEHIGSPILGGREALQEIRNMGFKIMIWTTRNQPDIIATALNAHHIPYDYINQNPNQPPEINPSKPVADYYIDDRAIRFVDWRQALSEIVEREKTDPYYQSGNDIDIKSEEAGK